MNLGPVTLSDRVRAALLAALFLLGIGAPGASAVELAPIGKEVFRESFEPGGPVDRYLESEEGKYGQGTARLLEMAGRGRVLEVHLPRGEVGDRMVVVPLAVEPLRGARVSFSAAIRGTRVTKPPELYNGVKFMLYTNSPTQGEQWQSVPGLWGYFEWTDLGFMAVIPPDATEGRLHLGLQNCTGTVWFDEVVATVNSRPRTRPATRPAPLPTAQLDRRTSVPRLRGVMYGPHGKEQDLRDLAAMGGNHIRWHFYYHAGSPNSGASLPDDPQQVLAAYDKWLEQTMAEVDSLLPLCEELGIHIVIDLHTPPGGALSGQWGIFTRREYQEYFIKAWDRLAERYRDQKAVWGYDLINEPSEGHVAPGLMGWRQLAETVAKRVRAIDPVKAIIVEPGQAGGWSNLDYFPPLDVPGVVYSVHVYDPLEFTHQGVLDGHPTGVMYPGEIGGKLWNRDSLRAHLQPVRDYQLDYNVPIYIGEFSAIRWAPGDSAATYLRDCISIFEEFGWDWAYHSWREWHGWNLELTGEKDDETTKATVPTERLKALQEGLAKNQ